jgi:hypothetical protein
MRVITWATAGAAGLVSTAAAAYLALVTGRVTLDLGVGRRSRPLGPLTIDISAPRDVVYAVAAAPYAERRPRALSEKVDIWDRTENVVLAAHRTSVGRGLTAVTVESVTFDPPRRIGFRLLRGPVPHVAETFEFEPTATGTGTRLVYAGELGTDLWRLGERWGDVVAGTWVRAVQASLDSIRVEAERRTG